MATWPPIAPGQTEYVVSLQESTLALPEATFKIPDGFTIRFAENVIHVLWAFKTLDFGNKCIIDLTPNVPPALPGVDGFDSSNAGQPMWGQPGTNGGDGQPGQNGRNGVSLTLAFNTWLPKGGLWIKTNGQDGGPGGNGGNGGIGGGWSCIDDRGEHRTNGGTGGNGGDGGKGGFGGDTAEVTLRISSIPGDIPVLGAGCADKRQSVSIPYVTTLDIGAIAVFGAPGYGGLSGKGGLGGPGGDGPPNHRKNCGWFTDDVFGGSSGRDGRSGIVGPVMDPCLFGGMGRCSPVKVNYPNLASNNIAITKQSYLSVDDNFTVFVEDEVQQAVAIDLAMTDVASVRLFCVPPERVESTNSAACLYFQNTQMDLLLDRFVTSGFTIETPATDLHVYNTYIATVTDSNSNKIVLVSDYFGD